MNQTTLTVVADEGKGRPFVLLHEAGTNEEEVAALATLLKARARVVAISAPAINDSNWSTLSSDLRASIAQLQLKQSSFLAFGAAGVLLQDLCLTELKLVRTAVFVDASTRPHPTALQRLIDRAEQILPLGLPLRLQSSGFDGRAFLHRIRCPALVVTRPESTGFQLHQAEVLSKGLPTAWRVHLEDSNPATLCALVGDFQEVPAKCPQKNVRAKSSPAAHSQPSANATA